MIAESLRKTEAGIDLSVQEAEEVMNELLEGRLAQEQIVGLLTSLRAKGEAVEELVGFARAMRRHLPHVNAQAQILAAGGYLRDGRRWRRHVQRIYRGGAGGGGRRRARGQARQPVFQFALRVGGRPGSAGREDRY